MTVQGWNKLHKRADYSLLCCKEFLHVVIIDCCLSSQWCRESIAVLLTTASVELWSVYLFLSHTLLPGESFRLVLPVTAISDLQISYFKMGVENMLIVQKYNSQVKSIVVPHSKKAGFKSTGLLGPFLRTWACFQLVLGLLPTVQTHAMVDTPAN